MPDKYERAVRDVKVTVDKAENPVIFADEQYWELYFSPFYQILELEWVENPEGDVSYEIISEERDGKIVNYCALDGTDLILDADAPVGTYTLVVRITVTGDDEYYKSAAKDSTVIIKLLKDDPVYKEPQANTLKYNGQAQELVKAGKAAGGSSKKGIRTGDDNYLAIWIVLLLASAAGTAVMALARKK